jgi:hypothetical protein
MPTIHLIGRILPEVVKVSLGHKPTVKWESPDIGLTMEFTNHITDSRIDVECKLNRWTSDTFVPVYMRALDLCRASVDVVAFAMGCGLSVFLDTISDPSGNPSPILCKDDRSDQECAFRSFALNRMLRSCTGRSSICRVLVVFRHCRYCLPIVAMLRMQIYKEEIE